MTLSAHNRDAPLAAMSDRFKAFTGDELQSLVLRLDISEAIDPLDPTTERLRNEMIQEIQERHE